MYTRTPLTARTVVGYVIILALLAISVGSMAYAVPPRHAARISPIQANNIALSNFPGTFVVGRTHLINTNGVLAYQVTLRTPNGHRQKVNVDAYSGRIIGIQTRVPRGRGPYRY